MITASVVEALLKCPTKCYLRSLGEVGTENVYANWVRAQNESYRNDGIKRLMKSAAPDECIIGSASALDLKAANWSVATDFVVRTQNLESSLHAVERIAPECRGKPAKFIPIRFILNNKLSLDDKLLLAFDALVLSQMLGHTVGRGKIIHGRGKVTWVNTSALANKARKVTGKIASLLSSQSPPDLILNRHCAECEFRAGCRKVVEKDDLSLLSGMTDKERKDFNNKGIFGVMRLSYTFRPRRRPKHLAGKREKYHHSLKALAIREGKIYIVGSPELKIEGTPVYLDVEGLPDRDFYYLIGIRFGTDRRVIQHSLWAEDEYDEKRIWREFLGILSGIERPVLIHYGSFETIFLKRMHQKYGDPVGGSLLPEAISSAVNLLSVTSDWYYKVGGLDLFVQAPKVDGGFIGRIQYYMPGKASDLSSKTIQKLLKQNAPGLVWHNMPTSTGPRYGAFTPEELEGQMLPDFPGEIIAWGDGYGGPASTYLIIAKNGYQGDDE
jgi:predicted RecB family nuclease